MTEALQTPPNKSGPIPSAELRALCRLAGDD